MTWHYPVNLVKPRELFRILWAVLYFTYQLFPAFNILFCRIANLWDIDLKFPGHISDVLQNFMKLACLEIAFSNMSIFRILVCNLQTGPGVKKKDFVPHYLYQHLVKISQSCVVSGLCKTRCNLCMIYVFSAFFVHSEKSVTYWVQIFHGPFPRLTTLPFLILGWSNK